MPGKLSHYLLVVLVLLGFSCEKEPEGHSLLTVVVEQEAIADNGEQWVYISEPSGKVLDSRKCKNGDRFELKGPIALEAIDVTIFRHTSGSYSSSVVSTFLGVTVGKSLTLEGASHPETLEPTGTATLEIVNYHEPMPPHESIRFINGVSAWPANSPTVTDDGLLATVHIYDSPQELLMTGFRGGQGVYYKVAAIAPDEHLVVDFDSFQEYDQIIRIPEEFNEVGSTTGYYADGRAYPLSSAHESFLYGSETSLGYIAGYDRYFTRFNEFYGPTFLTYSKMGEPASEMVFPSFTLSVDDRTPDGFSFDASFDYAYQSSTWFYSGLDQSGITWTVHGDATSSGRIPAIADVVFDKHPGMERADFSFYELTCTQRLDERTWADIASSIFESTGFAEYEYLEFTTH